MPPKKDNYMYVSQMNMTELKTIAVKETIDITGLNMKQIKDKIASDKRNFPKKFDVNAQKWSTKPEDASTYTGSTMGDASLARQDDTIEILKELQDTKEKELQTKVINKLKTMVNNKKMSKKQLLDKLALLEGRLKDEKEEITREERVTNKSMKEYMQTLVDKTTENEKKAKATTTTPPSTPPPTPKTSPIKTDDTRDYKQVKFQGLTKDENSNAKVQVKMARVQITKSDIEKELERQNNRRFGFQHNKISYNTHWGKQGGKISSELI